MEKHQISSMLKLTQALFFVEAAVWLVFGGLGFTRAVNGTSDWRFIISVLMLVNAGFMFWFGLVIIKGRSWIFFLAILYMVLNVVLSITDQFGWIDALILLLNLCLLGLLIVTRQRMIQSARDLSKG